MRIYIFGRLLWSYCGRDEGRKTNKGNYYSTGKKVPELSGSESRKGGNEGYGVSPQVLMINWLLRFTMFFFRVLKTGI